MPRLVNRLPTYRKHKASGQAIVTLSGHDHYLGPYGTKTSKANYDRLCGEYLTSGGVVEASDEIAIVQLLAAFWKHAQEHYGKDSTEPHNYSTLIKRLRKAYGNTLVCEFGPMRMKAFRQSLIDAKLSRTSINHVINRLRRIFKWGVENELVPPSVYDALKCVTGLQFGRSKARETEPVKPIADWAVDATLPYCSPQVATMISLQRLPDMANMQQIASMWPRLVNRGRERLTTPPAPALSIASMWPRLVNRGRGRQVSQVQACEFELQCGRGS
jgi:hypothetical protein